MITFYFVFVSKLSELELWNIIQYHGFRCYIFAAGVVILLCA